MANSPKPTVGFVGLGAMGFGMAANLVKRGYIVKGYDVWPPSVERFVAAGGIAAPSLPESAKGSDFYIVMVANAQQAQEALFEGSHPIVPALPRGAALLLCSTVPSSYAQSVQTSLKNISRDDILFVDCPVSGGAIRAANGTLSIMASAEEDALERAGGMLREMSDTNKLYLVPGGVGMGSNMKMVHQVLAGIHILGASEAMGFAGHLGLEAKRTIDQVCKGEAWSWMFENRVSRMLDERYIPPVSALAIILKDVGIITSQARLHGFPTPLVSTAEQVYFQGVGRGHSSEDDAGIVQLYFEKPIMSIRPKDPEDRLFKKHAMIVGMLRSLHIVAAAEAIAFARFLGIDLSQFYELACAAAGGSRVFTDRGQDMIAGIVKRAAGINVLPPPGNFSTIDQAVEELSAVMKKAQKYKLPLPLASAALNMFLLAKNKGLGAQPDSEVIQVWGV